MPPVILAPLRLGLGGGGDGHRGDDDDRFCGCGENGGGSSPSEKGVGCGHCVALLGKGFGCGSVPHTVCHIQQLGLDLQPTSSFHPQRP